MSVLYGVTLTMEWMPFVKSKIGFVKELVELVICTLLGELFNLDMIVFNFFLQTNHIGWFKIIAPFK